MKNTLDFLVALVGLLSIAVSAVESAEIAPPRIYVSNSGDDTVSVISLETLQVVATIPVGDNPVFVDVAPDGSRAYVINDRSTNVSVIDTASASVIATIPVGAGPVQLAVTRDGRHVYVTSFESSSICIIDTASNAVVKTNTVSPAPRTIAFHPIRDEVWIGGGGSGAVGVQARSVADLAILGSVASSSFHYASSDLAFLPDGSEAFGAEGCGHCGRFHRISGNHSGGTIGILQQAILYDNTGAALAATINPISKRAYLAKLGQVGPHYVEEFGTGRRLTFSAAPRDLAVTQDGELLFVANQAVQGFVSVIDTVTFAPVTNVNVGAYPSGIAIWQPLAPVITRQPQSTNVVAGATAQLIIAAAGAGPFAYQWRFGGLPIPTATNAALVLSNVPALAAGAYYAVVENAFGAVTSGVATVTVLAPPTFVLQPTDQVVRVGATAVFSVLVSGTQPLRLQWRLNSLPLEGETNTTVVIPNVNLGMHGRRYDVVATNAAAPGGVTSLSAFLYVAEPPSITSQPTNATVNLGETAIFCVSVFGSGPFRYQWRHNGANISGATNSCLILTNVQTADGGTYAAAIENPNGVAESDLAMLSIAAPLSVPGDNFAERFDLESFGSGFVGATNTLATKEPGEPDHAGKPGGRSVWYTWTGPTNGIVTFRTEGSAFDTLLGVYTGNTVSNLTTVSGDEDSGGFFSSIASFNVRAGQVYQIAVDGFGGAGGELLLSWNFESTSNALPTIERQPSSRTVVESNATAFAVMATGAGLRYQWYFNGAALSGETNVTLSIASVTVQHVGSYRARVSNSSGRFVDSQDAILEVGPVADVQSQDKFEDLFLGESGGGAAVRIRALTTSAGILSVSAGLPIAMILNNTNSTTQVNEPLDCRIDGASRWLTIRADSGGVCIMDTFGSEIDTVLGVYTGANPISLVIVGCNDNATTNVTWSRVRFIAALGTEYRVRVDGVNGQQGVVRLNTRIGEPPTAPGITPTNTVVQLGGAVVLSSGVTNAAEAMAQWYLNGREIPGETNSTLIRDNVNITDHGTYSVVVRNAFGAVTSVIGTLTVNVPYLARESRIENGSYRLILHLPPQQSLLVEASSDLSTWTALFFVPPADPIIELPVTNALRFFRAQPSP